MKMYNMIYMLRLNKPETLIKKWKYLEKTVQRALKTTNFVPYSTVLDFFVFRYGLFMDYNCFLSKSKLLLIIMDD